MSEENGYGSRIYVKKRKRFNPLPYIIIVVILGGSWYFFNSLNKDTTPVVSPIGSADGENVTDAEEDRYDEAGDVEYATDQSGTAVPVPEPSIPETLTLPPQKTGKKETRGKSPSVLSQAQEHFMNRRFDKALTLFKSISESDLNALLYTGICYYRLEDYPKSVTYLEKSLQKDSAGFLARKYLAFAHYKMDALEESLANAEAGLALLADNELKSLHGKILREKKVMKYYGDKQKVNFRFQFSKEEHNDIKDKVHFILKDAYREIGKKMKFYPEKPVTVILYNEKGFFDVTRAPGWAGGLYDGKIRLPIQGGVDGQEEVLERVLHHEYVHALVHAITPRCPHWLNEGLAVYFTEDEAELREFGDEMGQIIPLRLLENGFPGGDERIVLAAYLESYTAVAYLIDKYGLFRVKELLETLGRGESLSSAFHSVFYTSYKRFLDQWGKD